MWCALRTGWGPYPALSGRPEPYTPHRVEQTVYRAAVLDQIEAFQQADAASRELAFLEPRAFNGETD